MNQSVVQLHLLIPASSNGKTPGITQPGINGQEAVIRKTYKKAGLDWRDTSYVECHGTGTPVGDPIEVEGLSRVFSQDIRPPLLIGAVSHALMRLILPSNDAPIYRSRRIWVTVKRQVEYHLSSRPCLLSNMAKFQLL